MREKIVEPRPAPARTSAPAAKPKAQPRPAPSAPPQPPWKKRVVLRAGLASVLLVAAIPALVMLRSRDENPSAQIPPAVKSAAPFAHCKAAPGLVEAFSGERKLSFQTGGKLRAVFVDEGKIVKAGERIAELENADLAAKVKSSRADLSAAEARLGVLKVDLDSELQKSSSDVARLNAELALLEPRREDIDRAESECAAAEFDAKLAAEEAYRYFDPSGEYKSWARQLHDQAARKSQSAQAKCDALTAHLRALKSGSRPEEKDRARAMLASAEAEVARRRATNALQLKNAEAQVEQTRAQVELADAELEKTRLAAPTNGTVVRKFMYAGEVIDVLHPQPVVTLADLTQLRVRADVDEADFAQVHTGQRVKIAAESSDANAATFTGIVESVSSTTGQKRFSTGEAKERMDVKIIETAIAFDTPPPPSAMKLGLRVTAYFEVP